MKICLIYPDNDQHCDDPDALCHLGIGYVASYLIEHGYEVDLFDCAPMQINMYRLKKLLAEHKYDAIGLSAYPDNYAYVRRIIVFIRSIYKDIFIFVGGYLPTLSYQQMLGDMNIIDCLVLGDGEFTTLQLLNNFSGNLWKSTPGILYQENDVVINTSPGKYIENIDELPFPLRSGLLNDEVYLITARGCAGNCFYCSAGAYKNITCKKIRRRSPENVIHEVKHILCTTDIKTLFICDDNFLFANNGKQWFERFIKLINENDIHLKYNIQIRCDAIEEQLENLIRFKQVGLSRVFLGVESFIQSHLDYYCKNITVHENLKTIKQLENTDINVKIGYMLFNPIITINEILQTVSFFRKHNINKYKIINYCFLSETYVISYPGTPISKDIQERNCYSTNNRGYIILDKRSERCFNVMQGWNHAMRSVTKDMFNPKAVRSPKQIALMCELFHLDLDVLETVALMLMQNDDNITDDKFVDALQGYLNKGQEIYLKFNV